MQPLRKFMSRDEILKAYKDGERDFSNIECKEGDFDGLNLTGASLQNSDLSFSAFRDAILTDTDFTGAILEWTSFERANLTRAKFNNAKITWSVLNNAHIEKTEMKKTDLSWSLLFNTNWGAADSTGAILASTAFSPADITEEGLWELRQKLEAVGKRVDDLTHLMIESKASTTTHEKKKHVKKTERDSGYERTTTAEEGLAYGATRPTGRGTGEYGSDKIDTTSAYKHKKKKADEYK